MKSPILTLLFSVCFCFTTYSQIKIGDNPQSIDASSVLELESTSHVLVITRVTTTEMEAITPSPGGMVYNTDIECIHYYNGVSWINLCESTGALTNITTDPIVNDFRTIIITPNGETNHIEVGIIGEDQIQDNSINGTKIAENSITEEELAQNSVTSFQMADGTLLAEDFANEDPNQVLSTDINGIVNWVDATAIGVEADQTTIVGNGTTATPLALANSITNDITINTNNINTNTLAIAADGDTNSNNETLTNAVLTGNNLILTESGNTTTVNLGSLNNAGTDSQTLNLTGNTLAITGGNSVLLTPYLDNTDEQQLSITGNRITLTDGGFVDLPAGTVDTDEQNLTRTGNTINISNGTGVDLTPILSSGADGVVSTVALAGTDLNFTGAGGGFNGTVSLAGLGGGTNPEFNPTKIGGAGTTTNPYTIAPNAITAAEILNESILSEDILDGTITGNDISNGNITPIKIEPSPTLGQYLRTDPVSGNVTWDDLPTGTAGTVTTDGLTISGDGLATALSLANNAVTTVKILDGNVTPLKIDATLAGAGLSRSATGILSVDATTITGDSDITSDDLIVGGAANALLEGVTLEIDAGKVGETELANDAVTTIKILNDAITTAKILDDNITPAKIEQGTDGQVLTTNATNDVEWQNLTSDITTGSILFSNGTGGITENNGQLFWDTLNDRLGIGTTTPDSKLDVNGQIRASTIANGDGAESLPAYRFKDDLNSGMFLANTSELAFSTNSLERVRIIENGNVGINEVNPLERLHVGGNIRADGAITASGLITESTPDYVFQKYFNNFSNLNPSYNFGDLTTVENFIKENHHLPGVKSAEEIKKQGYWNLGKASQINLEKIEELFLHTIEQEKKIKVLEKDKNNLSEELNSLKKEIEFIKEMLSNK